MNLPLFELERFQFFNFAPVSLGLHSGEILGVQGPSGGGKSLFLRAIADLIPNQGEARYARHLLSETSGPDWRRLVGYVPARSAWWHDVVEPHAEQWNQGFLETLGFGPEVLSWKISRLSTGEQQRLALVRMLSFQPSVLLLDEPTAALDPENQVLCEQLLLHWVGELGRAMLWVSHDAEQRASVSTKQVRVEHREVKLL